VVADEPEAFARIRALLSYLPSNVWERAPRGAAEDEPERAEEELLSIVPRERRRVYDMRRLLSLVLDRGSFFELGSGYGRTQIVGLARDGHWACGPTTRASTRAR
jgi:acetyl-CoA carboxylase carboxyltransferase component